MSATQDKKPTTPAPRKGGRRTVAEIKAEVAEEMEASFNERLAAMEAKYEAKFAELTEKAAAAEAKAEEPTSESAQAQAAPPDLSDVEPDPAADDAVTIHFVEDGLTLFGKVWYRGEELTVRPGTQQWEEACDREGRMLLSMTETEQVLRWEKRFFAPGPWPYDNAYELNRDSYIKKDADGNETFDQAAYEADLHQLETIQKKREIRSATPGPKKARRIFS